MYAKRVAQCNRILVRNASTSENLKRFTNLYRLGQVWKFMPQKQAAELYPPAEKPFLSSRGDFMEISKKLAMKAPVFANLVLSDEGRGLLGSAKLWAKFAIMRGFTKGMGLEENFEEFLDNGKQVFHEVLQAFVKNDFTALEEHTLGEGVWDFHKNVAKGLTEKQKDALRITNDDFLGEDGYIMPNYGNISEYCLANYMHSLSFVNINAIDQVVDEKRQFARYSLMIGALRKQKQLFEVLEKAHLKDESVKLFMPKDYGFCGPRYVFLKMEICQEVENRNMQLHLKGPKMIYDVHLHSF